MNNKNPIFQISEDFFLLNGSGVFGKESFENKWLGYPPATTVSIEAKEKSLGIKLPPPYVDFLLVSNGFRNVSLFLDNLFSIEKVDWAKNLEGQSSLEMFNDEVNEVSDEQYFYYEEDQDPVLSRTRYISQSLKIAEWYDGMCLFLNPIIKFGDEWEVLEYATWFPGIHRYKSFDEYLKHTHLSNQRLLQSEKGKQS